MICPKYFSIDSIFSESDFANAFFTKGVSTFVEI
jgi:hypothetical protein